MSGRNTSYAKGLRDRVAELEEATSHKRPRLSPTSVEIVDPAPAPPGWSEGEATDAESFIPTSSAPNSTFSDPVDAPVISDVKINRDLEKELHVETYRLWSRESPDVCRKILRSVEFRVDGWCKLATKAPNVCSMLGALNV